MSKENYELPRGWVWTTIGAVAETTSGGTPLRNHPEYYGGAIPWVKSGELKDSIVTSVEEFITEEGLKNSSAKVFRQGTALVAMYGATVGKTGILGIDATTNQAICAIFPLKSAFTSKFIIYWLQSQRQVLIDQSAGGAQPNINQEIIRAFPLPLAPVAEQHRIVAAIEQQFTRLDAAIAALRRARAKLKRYLAAVLKAAVEGKLTEAWRAGHPTTELASDLLERILKERRARWEADLRAKDKDPAKVKYVEPAKPDIENLPELPEGWCWATLGQVAFFQNGRGFPSAEYKPEGFKLLRPGNLYADGTIQWSASNIRYLPEIWAERNPDLIVRGHEIVMNLTAQSLKDEFLGRVCITSKDEQCLLNQRLARITPLRGLNSFYALYMLKSAVFRQFVDGLNKGSLIQHMFTSQLENFSFPLPSVAEHEQIVAEVEQRLSIVTQLEAIVEANLKRAERLRQSILKEAFAGRLVPQDPDDEPASVLLERMRKEREEQKKGKATNGRYMNVPVEPVKMDVEGMRQVELWEM